MIKRLECDLSIMDIIGHSILWLLIIVVTLGIGILFYPYAFTARVLNNTYLVDEDGKRIGKLHCELDLASQLGHIVLWAIAVIVTLGLALPIYVYKVSAIVVNKTRVV